MTWAFIPCTCSLGREGELSPTASSDIDLLARLKSSHIPEKYCSHDSLMEAYLDSLFGITCARSGPTTQQRQTTSSDCAELLATWQSAVDSHAKTSAQQAEGQESKEQNRASGPNLLASFARFDPDTSSWRIPQCSLLGDSELYSETWPQWGMWDAGACWELPTLVPRISGSGSGLWPTPVAHDDGKTPEAHMRMKENMPGGERYKPTSLQVMAKGLAKGMFSEYLPTPTATNARQGVNSKAGGASAGIPLLPMAATMWPTPTKSDGTGGPGNSGRDGGDNLRTAVRFATPKASDGERGGRGDLLMQVRGVPSPSGRYKLPTPTAQDAHNNSSQSQQSRNSKPLNAEVGGSLNPDWVEWLMGWEIGFTALEPLEHSDPHPWDNEPDIPRISKGVKNRTNRLQAIGNGQVPQCAAAAWRLLAAEQT